MQWVWRRRHVELPSNQFIPVALLIVGRLEFLAGHGQVMVGRPKLEKGGHSPRMPTIRSCWFTAGAVAAGSDRSAFPVAVPTRQNCFRHSPWCWTQARPEHRLGHQNNPLRPKCGYSMMSLSAYDQPAADLRSILPLLTSEFPHANPCPDRKCLAPPPDMVGAAGPFGCAMQGVDRGWPERGANIPRAVCLLSRRQGRRHRGLPPSPRRRKVRGPAGGAHRQDHAQESPRQVHRRGRPESGGLYPRRVLFPGGPGARQPAAHRAIPAHRAAVSQRGN